MNIDEALRLLERLRGVAPSATASRITDVMGLIETLGTQQNGSTQSDGANYDGHPVPANLNDDHQNGEAPPDPLSIITLTERLTNTLQLIEGQASSLRAGRLGRVTTEQADALKLVVEYATSGTDFLNIIRQLSMIQRGVLAIDPLVFNPLDAAAEAWQRTFPLADSRDHQFTIMADNPLPYVRGDYQHVMAILVSLVDNAIRYMPFGGEIRLSVNTLGTHLLFNIADHGIGLTSDDHKHVGEPFWRAMHQPLVKQHPGSGLSLHLARKKLELMDGELFYSGEPGIGSTFSFTLPADMD